MEPPGNQQYLSTIQPEYRNLGFASEVTRLFWDYPDENILKVDEVNDQEKVKRTLRFLRRLNIIDGEELTYSGVWLATVFEEPKQQSLNESSRNIGQKDELSAREQEGYLSLLTGNHWLPMLATVHHISKDKVPKQRSDRPVSRFAQRINHLEPYSGISHSALRTRANVHYGWFHQLGLAKVRDTQLVLTDAGTSFEREVKEHYPADWAQFE